MRLVLAEDNALLRAGLIQLLDTSGFEIVHAVDNAVELDAALADRGLDGAVRALALDMAVPVDVAGGLTGSPPLPIESAVYFAVAECLANSAKHALHTHAWVELSHGDGLLRVVLGDDGHGGADVDAGTGMKGVMRRLAAFDGTMSVSSPDGGPTIVILEVPCALASSSPRTVPSSASA